MHEEGQHVRTKGERICVCLCLIFLAHTHKKDREKVFLVERERAQWSEIEKKRQLTFLCVFQLFRP